MNNAGRLKIIDQEEPNAVLRLTAARADVERWEKTLRELRAERAYILQKTRIKPKGYTVTENIPATTQEIAVG